MAIFPNIEIFGIYDRGIPNSERIVLRVSQPTKLSNYFLMLGITSTDLPNNIWPIKDQFMWLPDITMQVPGWVFVYTGHGTPSVSQEINTFQPIQNVYWNKNAVVLTDPDIHPALVSFGAVEIGNQPNKVLPNANLLPPPPPSVSENAVLKLMEALKSHE